MKFRVFKKQIFGGYSKKDVNDFVIELSAENDKNFAELQRFSSELRVEKRQNEELAAQNSELSKKVSQLEQNLMKFELERTKSEYMTEQLKKEFYEQSEFIKELEKELDIKQAELDNKVLPLKTVHRSSNDNESIVYRNGTDGSEYSDDSGADSADGIQNEINKIKSELKKILNELDLTGAEKSKF